MSTAEIFTQYKIIDYRLYGIHLFFVIVLDIIARRFPRISLYNTLSWIKNSLGALFSLAKVFNSSISSFSSCNLSKCAISGCNSPARRAIVILSCCVGRSRSGNLLKEPARVWGPQIERRFRV